jgi:hypothetical protein
MLNEKRLFARLLSKEDIVVTQSSKVKTASFDVVSRVITFPIYKDMAEINLTGFTCHEVGHALHTTPEVMELSKRFGHTVVNVVEDLRCNNLMKSEFKGISNIFNSHYSILNDRKFFGEYDYKSGFLDKINLANKLRVNLFQTPEEIEFWKRYSDIETIEELIEACKYVVDYYKDNEEQPQQEQSEDGEDNSENGEDESEDNSQQSPSIFDEDEDESEDGEDESEGSADNSEGAQDNSEDAQDESEGSADNSEDGEDGEDAQDESEDGEDESEGSADNSENGEDTSEDGEDKSFDPDAIKCDSEEEFEKSLEESVEDSWMNRRTDAVIPRTKDMKSLTISYKDVWVQVDENFEKNLSLSKHWNSFNGMKKKIVDRMVATFNRNKAASEYHRRRFSDTGSLNMKKLYQYKTNDDIFLKNMKIEDGKNHGVIFYLDTSGSMSGKNGLYTVKQIAIMTAFCRKLNIPYTVLGFTGHDVYYSDEERVENVVRHNVYNIELLSHKQSDQVHNNMMFALWRLFQNSSFYNCIIRYKFGNSRKDFYSAYNHDYNAEPKEHVFQLGGTPLHRSMINSIPYADEFKKKNGVQVLNIMYFTDGDDTGSLQDNNNRHVDYKNIVDAQTKKKYNIDDYKNGGVWSQYETVMLANMIKDRMDCNVFFMYIPYREKQLTRDLNIVGSNAKRAFSSQYHKNTFHKVVGEGAGGIEYYILYVGAKSPEEVDFSKIKVETDNSGKAARKSLTQLRRAMSSSNASLKGANLFARLVAEKVAEGV